MDDVKRVQFTKVSPIVPGEGPITSVTLFAGHIFAARGGIVYRLDDDGWIEICLEKQK